jgi:serine/threonine-protein kinase
MTDQANAPPAEQQDFALLDAYDEGLRAGRPPDKERFVAEHPGLADAVECLEALAHLAAPLAGAPSGPPTMAYERNQAEDFTGAETVPFALPALPSPSRADFGRYELLGELGRGGMGVVYKARQKDLDRLVALKMILASHLASEEQVRRFYAEAKAAAGLHHPHILQIYEVGEVHGQHYFAMEYVEGKSLADVLREGPLPSATAVSCLAAVARGVAHLHARGIVHRDVKPSNILLDRQDRPFLTDFGLVKRVASESHLTNTGAIVGTPSYMAPEQAAGRADVGPLCDVYSLGAVLYELLTGRPPFRGENPMDTLVQVLESEATLPTQVRPGIPRELELICLKCLEKTPANRYPSAEALADDLERFVRGEPVEARPQTLGQRLQRWTRREPALAAHLAILAVCIAIIHVNYHLAGNVTRAMHLQVLSMLGAWGLVAVLFQALLRRDWRPGLVRAAWLAADAVLLTAVLATARALATPVVCCYALFIAAAGLWFRVRLVWFATALAGLGYGILLVANAGAADSISPHHHVIFLIVLAVLGYVVAYQVQRVRVLSQYYEHRPLP